MNCMICQSKEDTKYLPLYVIGSEGLNICHSCEMMLVHYIQDMMRVANVSKKMAYKSMRKCQMVIGKEYVDDEGDIFIYEGD